MTDEDCEAERRAITPDPEGSASAQWAARITAAWRKTREMIIETGQLLIEAKAALPHGEFLFMIECDLPFGARTAQMLMKIGADERLTDAKHVSHLPSSWGTLYELTKQPDAQFQAGLSTGEIHPEMERHEVSRLLDRARVDDLDPPPRPVIVQVTQEPNPPLRVMVREETVAPPPFKSAIRRAAAAPAEPPKVVVTFPVAHRVTDAASPHGPALDLSRTTDPVEVAEIIFGHLGRDRARAVAVELAKLIERFDRDGNGQ
jgi:hypothetical protein